MYVRTLSLTSGAMHIRFKFDIVSLRDDHSVDVARSPSGVVLTTSLRILSRRAKCPFSCRRPRPLPSCVNYETALARPSHCSYAFVRAPSPRLFVAFLRGLYFHSPRHSYVYDGHDEEPAV